MVEEKRTTRARNFNGVTDDLVGEMRAQFAFSHEKHLEYPLLMFTMSDSGLVEITVWRDESSPSMFR